MEARNFDSGLELETWFPNAGTRRQRAFVFTAVQGVIRVKNVKTRFEEGIGF